MGVGPFFQAKSDTIRGHNFKLCQGKVRLDIRKKLFIESCSNIGTSGSGKWFSHHLWRYSKATDVPCGDVVKW